MIQAFCWMLIHSLWQGAIFTVATGLVMWGTKKQSSVMRYRLLSGLFFVFVGCCAGTFWREWMVSGHGREGLGVGILAPVGSSLSALMHLIGPYCSAHAAPIVLIWFIVFLYKCARTMGSLIYTQRIRHYGVHAVSPEWEERMRLYCQRLGIQKAVRLVESRIVRMPLTAGHLKPIIFVPLGLLAQLPAGEVEAMLLHELAHIRRHDYLVNFMQHWAENIFFFNPALLWMSALLRTEREHCCDDIAIEQTNYNKIQYIQALINFKEYDLGRVGMANSFSAGKHQLMNRVLRIAQDKRTVLNAGERLFFLSSVVAVLLLAVTAGPRKAPELVAYWSVLEDKDRVTVNYQDPVEGGKTETKFVAGDVGKVSATLEGGAVPVAKIRRQIVKEDEPAGQDREQPIQGQEPTDQERADQAGRRSAEDRQQAALDRVQADRDQAERDREQADRSREQAVRDREQADRDRAQADRDRVQANKDKEQADRDHVQADKDRQQAERDREQAERNRQQTERDRLTAKH